MKASAMFASLAEAVGSSDNIPPSPPLTDKKPTAKEKSHVVEKYVLQMLMGFAMTSIPGIGYETAAIIVSEMGTILDRFPDEKHFVSYIGLAPSLGKSAGKNVPQKRRCRNTFRVGRVLRMAASTLYRSQSELGAYFRNVARQTDKKTAIKATARRMAHMIYRGVKYGQEYIDQGAQAYEERMRERAVRTVNRLIKSFNITNLELSGAEANLANLAAN